MHILTQGTVKLWHQGRYHVKHILQILSTMGSTNYVPDLLTLFRPTSFATCESLTPCHFRIVRTSHFQRLLRKDKDFSIQILNMLAKESECFQTKLRLERECSARERVAFLLLELIQAEELTSTDRSRITLSLPRKDFVAFTGLTRETVARILSEFSRKKWTHLKRNQITILKSEPLSLLASQAGFSRNKREK